MLVAMVVDTAGEAFIRKEEGCVLELYDDDAGNCTVGTGHLVHYGRTGTNPPAEEPYANGITMEQNDELLMHDIAGAEDAVNSYVEVDLTQTQFNVLVDWAFECGTGALLHSTLLTVLNAGNYAEVPAQLERWVYDGGKKSNGMVNRRAAEVALWNS